VNAVELLRFHRSLLGDQARLEQFRRAIDSNVKPGDVVLDLGTGTGVLAVFAARAGARIVYAVEATNIIELARRVLRENGVDERVVFLDQMSPRVELPEQADVLVTETIGNFGFDEGILGWVEDARRRLLKPRAPIVPQSIELYVALVEAPEIYARITDWKCDGSGMSFESVRTCAVNTVYPERIASESLLSDPQSLGMLALAEVEATKFDAETELVATRSGTLHGLGGWFSSRLCDGVTISNGPEHPVSSWNQVFLPFQSAVAVCAGDRLHLSLACRSNGSAWRWQLESRPESPNSKTQSRDRIRFDQSTFYGVPETLSRLHRRAADFSPRLNLDGRLVRFLVALMDGSRTLEELSMLTFAEFPDRFADQDEALEQVREISAEFGQ
jgi:enediyne biosynthesis protein CalE3